MFAKSDEDAALLRYMPYTQARLAPVPPCRPAQGRHPVLGPDLADVLEAFTQNLFLRPDLRIGLEMLERTTPACTEVGAWRIQNAIG